MTDRTPYDTGSRAQPLAWVRNTGGEWIAGSEYQRPAESDDFGRVDFDGDDGSTLATVYAERQGDGMGAAYILDVFAHDYDGVIVRESNDDANADMLAALKTWREAQKAFSAACGDEDNPTEPESSDYWNRDDAGVEFANIAEAWIARRLGVEL